jgi:hypothetical protein
MATNAEVIQDALGLIGVTDDFNLTAEYGALGLRAMNDLLTMWEANEVDVGYFEQDNLTDDNPVDPEYLLAVKYNLAIAMAPYFSKEPSGALVSVATSAYRALLRKEMDSRLEAVDSLNSSLGEAWGKRYNILTDS